MDALRAPGNNPHCSGGVKSLSPTSTYKLAMVVSVNSPFSLNKMTSSHFIRSFLEDYKKEKKISILLASHNMNEVTRLCKSILMMKDGIIVDSGSPANLIEKHGRKNLEEVFLKLSRRPNEHN